jgi:hypothetical protein
LWSLYVGWCFFTAFDKGTAAIRAINGKEVETTYTDKNGVTKTGHLTSGGSYDGVILPWGYRMKDCTEKKLLGKQEIEEFPEKFEWTYMSILRRSGIYWIGFPPARRLSYQFVWTEFSDDGKVILRNEPTNFFYVARAEYAITTKDVEIGGDELMIVDLDFSVFIRIVVPEISFNRNVNFMAQLGKILKTEADTFFRPIRYEELKKKENEDMFSGIIKKIKTKITLGVIIDEVRLTNVGGTISVTIRTALEAKLVANKTGDAKIITAKKEGDAKLISATLEAKSMNKITEAIEKRYEAQAKYPEMARYDAIKTAGASGSAIVFEGPREMDDGAKNMLVAMKSTLPKAKQEKSEDATDMPEDGQKKRKEEAIKALKEENEKQRRGK